MGDLAQAGKDLLQQARGEGERVSAGKQHIADLWSAFDIVYLQLEILAGEGLGGITHDARAGAVAAVDRALGGDQHQHSIRVAVDQAWDRRMAVLGERILHLPGEGAHFLHGGDDLLADWVVGVIRVDERNKVGGHIHAEEIGAGKRFFLARLELEHLLELLHGIKSVGKLPAPVVPFFGWDILENRGDSGGKFLGHFYLFIAIVLKHT